jgi:hypothetical protein
LIRETQKEHQRLRILNDGARCTPLQQATWMDDLPTGMLAKNGLAMCSKTIRARHVR